MTDAVHTPTPARECVERVALLGCPFCGEKAEIERVGNHRHSTIYICTGCGCSLETGEEWNHGSRWNERHLIPVGAYPQQIGRLHLGDKTSDGDRLCAHSHNVPVGHPLYWPQMTGQYDDSDPHCLEHAIDQAVSDNGWHEPAALTAMQPEIDALQARLATAEEALREARRDNTRFRSHLEVVPFLLGPKARTLWRSWCDEHWMPIALARHFSWGPKAMEAGGEAVAEMLIDVDEQVADGRAKPLDFCDSSPSRAALPDHVGGLDEMQ